MYFANQDIVTTTELYVASIAGGASVKLNGPIVAGGSLIGFQISPDGSGVVYRATQNVPAIIEFYGVAITGGPVSKINGALKTGRTTTVSTLNNQSVVYASDQDTDDIFELYASNIQLRCWRRGTQDVFTVSIALISKRLFDKRHMSKEKRL